MDVSTQFLFYRAGWLVGGGVDNQLRQYDANGRVVASGRAAPCRAQAAVGPASAPARTRAARSDTRSAR